MREDIGFCQVFCESQCYIETISAEINLKKRKPFLNASYNSHRNSISNTRDSFNSLIDKYIEAYDNFIFIQGCNNGRKSWESWKKGVFEKLGWKSWKRIAFLVVLGWKSWIFIFDANLIEYSIYSL